MATARASNRRQTFSVLTVRGFTSRHTGPSASRTQYKLIPEDKLVEAKAGFESVSASHLYSLSKPGTVSNAAMWNLSQEQDEQLFNQACVASVPGR